MTGLIVPQLGRKIRLLVEYGIHPSIEAVARTLDRSPITLRGWGHGSSGTVPNRVPPQVASAFLELYAAALPDLAPEQVRQLVLGPADDLEAMLSASAAPSLMVLITREADRTSGTLFDEKRGRLSLIRTNKARAARPLQTIELGRALGVEFATRSRAGFAVALQSASGGWGLVPCTLDRASGRIYLPNLNDNGSRDMLREDNEIGPHLSIAAQAGRPFPPEPFAAARDGLALDRTLLAHFARNFEAQDKTTRRLFALDLEIVRPVSNRERA